MNKIRSAQDVLYVFMKITFIQILMMATFASLVSAASLEGQVLDKRITLEVHNKKIEFVLKDIEKQIPVIFTYRPDLIPVSKIVSVTMEDRSLRDVLAQLLGPEIEFVASGEEVLLKPIQIGSVINEFPNIVTLLELKGKVVDEMSEPLPGVNIVEKGSTNGTTTDTDGEFVLNVAGENSILIFSFIGYENKELLVGTQTELLVTLKPDVKALDEVVVVGYGTQMKADLTGSVSSLNSKALKQVLVLSPDQALQGRVAGVDVTQTSGQPGASNRIRVRGGNSISAGNEPLYVIDGFPIYNDNSTTSTGAGRSPSLNALATINPSDIESIEVLKDASATAIYGSRGANGVILITTKRGKAGISDVSFESSVGVQQVRKTIPMLNASEYASFENEIFLYQRDVLKQNNRFPVYTDEQIASLGEGTNWQDELFHSAPIQNYQLSFTGGDEKLKYSLIGGYTDQEGIIINSDFKRYSMRVNLDLNVSPRFRVGNSSTVSRTSSNLAFTGNAASIQGSDTGLVGVALHFNPINSVRDPATGEYTFQDQNVGEFPGGTNRSVPFYNPIALADLATNKSKSLRTLNNVFAEFDVLENLTFRSSLGADFITTKQNSYLPGSVKIAASVGGSARIGQVESFSWLSENTMTYRIDQGKHNLNFLAGFTAQSSRTERFQVEDAGFINDILADNNIGTGSVATGKTQPNISEWGLLSYLGRANYGYNDRYLFTLTARYDGSSRFGTGNKWGFFPSAAFAWKLSEEPFIKNLGIFSRLKMRTSYGLTGNQEIGAYQSIAQMGSGLYTIGGNSVAAFSPTRVANPNLKWESTAQFDLGLDIGIFKDRISFVVDYYLKNTTDLLLNVQVPTTSGFSSSLQNIGEVRNRGFEFGLNSLIVDKAVTWDLTVSLATNKNTVLDLGDESQRLIYSGWNVMKGQPASILEIGKPIGSFIGWKTDGWFLTDEEAAAAPNQTAADQNPLQLGGNIRYVDINKDNVVNDQDRTLIGNALPKWTGGFSSNASFKGFQVSTAWAFSLGNDIMNFNKLENNFGIGRYNASKNFNNRWSYMNTVEQNRNATAPTVLDSRNLFSVIDYWVEDASYLRMRNITITYNVPFKIKKVAQQVQVYVAGQNLITITDYSGFDPEVNLAEQNNLLLGYDYGAYPSSKSFIVGLRANFK